MSIEIRTASADEAPEIRALLEEHAQAAFGEPELSEDEVRSWFKRPKLSISVAERDGALAGYLDIYADDSGRFPADVRSLDPDVARVLLSEAERLAREQGAKAVRAFAQGDEPVLRNILEEDGWQPIRYSFQMRIDLTDDVPEPTWPDGLAPRNLRPDERERVYEANMEAFADHWDFHPTPLDEWLSFTVNDHSFEPSLWWLVDDGDELAAFTINSWHFSGDPQFGWVGILGVRKPWRRRGLATALLLHSFRDFRDRGATRAGLGVDGENTTGAVRLYEQVGMQVARRNDTYEKTL